MRSLLALAGLGILLGAGPAHAFRLYEDPAAHRWFDFTGYAQPYWRMVDDPCVYGRPSGGVAPACAVSTTPDGFGLTRARPIFRGQLNARTSFHLELRTVPNVELLDLRLHFELVEGLRLTVGRFRVPFSRQEMTSESRLQLPDRASFIANTPGRQLGTKLRYETGFGALPERFLTVEAGIYNGESAKERAPINNIDEDYLYAARVQVAPFGAPAVLFEGDVRPLEARAQPLVVVGASWTFDTRGPQNGNYDQRRLGADLLALWHGVSLYGEFYRYDRDYKNDGTTFDPDRHGVGWNVQAGAFVPAPYVREHLELAGRVEAWDPEIAREARFAPQLLSQSSGSGPGRPSTSTQAHRNYVAGVNWYFEGHDLKLQAAYTHRVETEAWQLSQEFAGIPQDVDDDSFRLQLTYRF